MDENEINNLSDQAFEIIKEVLAGKRKMDSSYSAACEFVRNIQLFAWVAREEERKKEKEASNVLDADEITRD